VTEWATGEDGCEGAGCGLGVSADVLKALAVLIWIVVTD